MYETDRDRGIKVGGLNVCGLNVCVCVCVLPSAHLQASKGIPRVTVELPALRGV